MQNETTEDAHFVRRRIELPVSPGSAASTNEMASSSDWGIGERLQIGDIIEPLSLPRADGTHLDLEDAMGDGPAVIITYRAFW